MGGLEGALKLHGLDKGETQKGADGMSMTFDKPVGYRYGRWAGNPQGHAEDVRRCAFEVWPNERGRLHHQCERKRGYGPDGRYCKQHARLLEQKP